ncbi:MAG TPA: TerD family protein [Telluria sp.]
MHVSDVVWPKGTTELRVLHWRHKKPYLGSMGWQVAEVWLPVEEALDHDPGASIALPPSIVAMLEQGSNYQFSVRIGGVELMHRALLWKVSGGARSAQAAARNDAHIDQSALGTRGTLEPTALVTSLDKSAGVSEVATDEARAREALLRAWEAARQTDTRSAYAPFLVEGGAFFDQAQHELAHFLPNEIFLRTSYTHESGAIAAFRLDTCVFLLDATTQVRSDRDFICSFATEHVTGASLSRSVCGSVVNLGHSQPLQCALATETIAIKLSTIPSEIASLAVTLSLTPTAPVHCGLETVEFAVTEIVDSQTKATLLAIDFAKGQFGIKGIYLAELVKRGGDWKLVSHDETFVAGLDAICAHFGIAVE